MSLVQVILSLMFAAMFVAIAVGKYHRVIPAAIGAALTIIFIIIFVDGPSVLKILNLGAFSHFTFWYGGSETASQVHGVNWQTVVFIFGMMVMVEGLADVGFFRWLCILVARLCGCKVSRVFIGFMLLSGFLAMFIDSITVLLFLATTTIELSRLLKFDPVPVIIAEISAANIGGSATMAGDPPNIIIGTSFGFTFTDFLTNTGPIAWLGLLLAVGMFYLMFRKVLVSTSGKTPAELMAVCPAPNVAIVDFSRFKRGIAIFILVVVLLVTHAQTGLQVAAIGIIAAVLTLLNSGGMLPVLRRVDWLTLGFFVGLFVAVGGLEVTGVLKALSNVISQASQGNESVVNSLIMWVSAFASAIVDNIPFAAAMVPVIAGLADQGMALRTLSWSLALGTDIGGNATPIGASANVVGTAIAYKEGYPIGWGQYCRYALPGMIAVVALSNLFIIVRYF